MPKLYEGTYRWHLTVDSAAHERFSEPRWGADRSYGEHLADILHDWALANVESLVRSRSDVHKMICSTPTNWDNGPGRKLITDTCVFCALKSGPSILPMVGGDGSTAIPCHDDGCLLSVAAHSHGARRAVAHRRTARPNAEGSEPHFQLWTAMPSFEAVKHR